MSLILLIDEKTHVCVLNACSYSDLSNEARSIFDNIPMKNKWIYTNMVVKDICHYYKQSLMNIFI